MEKYTNYNFSYPSYSYCGENEDDDDEEGGNDDVNDVIITCPSHFCDVCHAFYGPKRGNGAKYNLHRCIFCAKAYHLGCIVPGSRYNTMCLLCPDHPETSLPSMVSK